MGATKAIHLADEQNELLTSLLASARSRLEPHVGTADLQRGKYWRNRSNRWFRCIFRIQALFPFWFRWRSSRANRLVGRGGVVGALQALDGKASPNTVVVQVPGPAAVVKAELRSSETIRRFAR
jgi:hypothetical protein